MPKKMLEIDACAQCKWEMYGPACIHPDRDEPLILAGATNTTIAEDCPLPDAVEEDTP